MNLILLGDCLTQHEHIPDGSVDLILTDLPYGTIKGMDLPNWNDKTTEWDNAIDPVKVFTIANRILRKNGKMVLFSQEPYTTRLVVNALPNVPFCYRLTWKKDNFANHLGAKKAPVNFTEDILVFSKNHQKYDFEGIHPLRDYFRQISEFVGLTKKEIITKVGQKADHCFRHESSQFSLCTENTYNHIIEVFGLQEMSGFREFSGMKAADKQYRQDLLKRMNDEFPSVFNLWEGGKYKSNILEYRKDYTGYHPTQKPVPLLEDLIKTYSNPGDRVVDLTAGSGSTAVACQNSGRFFTVIEMTDKYYQTILKRTGNDFAEILDF